MMMMMLYNILFYEDHKEIIYLSDLEHAHYTCHITQGVRG